MEQLILINKESKPVVIEVPEKPTIMAGTWDHFEKIKYDQAVQSAIADESKHIHFKDEFEVWRIMDKSGCFSDGVTMVESVGQTFQIPEGWRVRVEEVELKRRKIAYKYMESPYTTRIKLQHYFGTFHSELSEIANNKKFFTSIVSQGKVSELADKLGLKPDRIAILEKTSDRVETEYTHPVGVNGTCVSCDQEKEVHELCLECAVKLGHDNPKPTAVAEPVNSSEEERIKE